VIAASLGGLLRAVSEIRLACLEVLCEDGSTADPLKVLGALEPFHPVVHVEELSAANDGLVLKDAITAPPQDTLVTFITGWWSIDFVERTLVAVTLRGTAAAVVYGSEAKLRSADARPLVQRLFTGSFNSYSRRGSGFSGLGTRGMNAFGRSAAEASAAGRGVEAAGSHG
jgi:hypothetical protein